MSSCGKILIYGVGLIGGSLAAALKNKSFANEIVGFGRTQKNLEKAVELGVIDRIASRVEDELQDTDIVVVATPVLATKEAFRIIAGGQFSSCVITDVGSVKRCIVEYAQEHFGVEFSKFVPAHPIAGREHSGVNAATADLFLGKRTILTPTQRTNPDAVDLVRTMWETVGSTVSSMEVQQHDDLLAASSHLPHLMAFALVNYVANHTRSEECFELAASGFYDFTRIASSDPVMWHDICMTNPEAVARELQGYIEQLESMRTMLCERNSPFFAETLRNAKSVRDRNLANWLNNTN